MPISQEIIYHGEVSARLWGDMFDDNTIMQVARAGRLPILAGPVALMPDGHVGIGATVGSVIATKGSVIPSAVGVDLGCFLGTTKIPLLDGRQMTLQDMTTTGGVHWVYSINKDKKLVPGKATAVKTRSNAELIKIIISGGEEIICTPDHEFMLSDGSYRQACELKFNDSLMPLYRKWQERDGYESVSCGKGTSVQTHTMVYEFLNDVVPSGYVVHHKNHNHFDNSPDNLELLSVSEHSRHHRDGKNSFANHSFEFQEKRLAGIQKSMEAPDRLASMVKTGIENITKYMQEKPEHFKNSVADNGKRGAPYLAKFNTSPRVCSDCDEVAPNPASLRWHKKKIHNYNHKVISITSLSETADVFCLQVEDHNNFALAAGVFVHNCGMIATKTNLTADDLPEDMQSLMPKIERSIPAGVGNGFHESTKYATKWFDKFGLPSDDSKLNKRALQQFGSLGSGNHFFEICLDENNTVWIVLHSGSRGVGNQLAQGHIKTAKKDFKKWVEGDYELEDKDLAWYVQGTPEFDAYIKDMLWSQEYALGNREAMMEAALKDVFRHVGKGEVVQTINCHHNFCQKEIHDDEEVWVTRKGAIKADVGDWGIIPGSMGAKSFIIKGKGNPQSWNSCSHGAGRLMSRSEAKRRFTKEDLAKAMGDRVWLDKKGAALVDEIPQSYKPIEKVMEAQSDLVEIVATLHQIFNYKGCN